MVAVAMEGSLLDAGNAGQSIKADGGMAVEAGGKNYTDGRQAEACPRSLM